jgi:hypothetical protein
MDVVTILRELERAWEAGSLFEAWYHLSIA